MYDDPGMFEMEYRTALDCGGSKGIVVLDRDGVLNVDHGYVHSRENFDWVAGIVPLLTELTSHGCRMMVATNQAGIARGYYSVAEFKFLTNWMIDSLSESGAYIDTVMYSPFHVEGVIEPFNRGSNLRKPNGDMIDYGIRKYNADRARSVMIGDSEKDMIAAEKAGLAVRIKLGGSVCASATHHIEKINTGKILNIFRNEGVIR